MAFVQSSLYSIAIGFCLLCSLFLLSTKNRIPLKFFLTYLMVEGFGLICEWLILHPSVPYKAALLAGMMGSSLLVAPCLWLFAREISEHKSPRLLALPAWHFTTIGIALLLLVPLMSSAHGGYQYENIAFPVSAGYAFFIHTCMLAAVAIFSIQTSIYVQRCWHILRTRASQNKSLFARIDDAPLNTLRILIIAVVGNWIVSGLRTLYCLALGADNGVGVLFALLDLVVISYAIFSVFQQEMAYTERERQTRRNVFEQDKPGPKYAHSRVPAELRQSIAERIDRLMTMDEIYTNSELSLAFLCEELNESPHTVSQVINESSSTNFYGLVNSHRIAKAKKLLLAEPEKSVLEIAYAVGYNSKSTFNSAFRRFTATTPSQFRHRKLAQSLV